MKPFIHSKNSVKKYGGKPEDYMPIHNFIDSSKSAIPDMRHRSYFHNAFGIFIIEKIFGSTIVNSDGKEISVRDIAEDHVIEDMGFIPTLENWLSNMKKQKWMFGNNRKKAKEKFIKID